MSCQPTHCVSGSKSSPYPVEPTRPISADLPPVLVRMFRVRYEPQTQSDRGAAILGGAYVESILEGAIKSKLVDLKLDGSQTLFDRIFKGYGPLATFSSKIDLGFGLQLIGERSYRDLAIIRRIRNAFAHDLEPNTPDKALTFQVQSIVDRCSNLWIPKNYATKEMEWMKENGQLDHPRGQFIYAVVWISWLIWGTQYGWQHLPGEQGKSLI